MLNKQGLFSPNDRFRRDARPEGNTGTAHASPVATPGLPASAARSEGAKTEAPAAAGIDKETPGSRLIVGPDIKLKGAEITDCDTLVVEGHVEASMDSRVIQIAEQGDFVGTVGIDTAEIHGRFEGELTARKHLIIHATGKVSGKIRYGKLVIEEGGELAGDVGMLGTGNRAAPAPKPAAQPQPQPLLANH